MKGGLFTDGTETLVTEHWWRESGIIRDLLIFLHRPPAHRTLCLTVSCLFITLPLCTLPAPLRHVSLSPVWRGTTPCPAPPGTNLCCEKPGLISQHHRWSPLMICWPQLVQIPAVWFQSPAVIPRKFKSGGCSSSEMFSR